MMIASVDERDPKPCALEIVDQLQSTEATADNDNMLLAHDLPSVSFRQSQCR